MDKNQAKMVSRRFAEDHYGYAEGELLTTLKRYWEWLIDEFYDEGFEIESRVNGEDAENQKEKYGL